MPSITDPQNSSLSRHQLKVIPHLPGTAFGILAPLPITYSHNICKYVIIRKIGCKNSQNLASFGKTCMKVPVYCLNSADGPVFFTITRFTKYEVYIPVREQNLKNDLFRIMELLYSAFLV